MLRQISLGTLGLIGGGILTVIGFGAYFTDHATLNLVGFFYGIPLLLGGLALKAAELKPVPLSQASPAEILTLRSQQATATQNQIRQDVTRFRYGQKAHLDTALSFLGLSPTDEERPVLTGLRETSQDGAYTLVLEFSSPQIPLESWQSKQEKMTRFFGPGVQVAIAQPAANQIDLFLTSLASDT